MECTMDQNRCVSHLKPIPATMFDKQAESDKANEELGGVAWTVLTRADILVHVGKLQRIMKDVNVSYLKDRNTVLKCIKRVTSTIRFSRPSAKCMLDGGC
eukprot:7688136-Pyramimonas_sp.AAC.1